MKDKQEKTLPPVSWSGRKITRLLLGQNPVKGGSHFSADLSAEMGQWHADSEKGLELMKRSEECGINTIQCGGESMHRLVSMHKERGGKLNWIV